MDLFCGFMTAAFFGTFVILMRASFKIDDLREEGRHYRYWHGKIMEFVHQHANMRDDRGISSGDYDSQQVEKKWKTLTEMEREFYETEDSDVQ